MASRRPPRADGTRATRDVITVLDALGVPVILVETVGKWSGPVEIARVAHTVVLVEALVDKDVQALKAA